MMYGPSGELDRLEMPDLEDPEGGEEVGKRAGAWMADKILGIGEMFKIESMEEGTGREA